MGIIFLEMIKNSIFLGIFLFVALGVGRGVLRAISFEAEEKIQNWCISFALGSGFLSLLVLVSSPFFPLNEFLFSVIFCILFFFFRKDILFFTKEIVSFVKDFLLPGNEKYKSVAYSLLIVVFCSVFFSSLGTLLSSGWDTFHQYLVFPNIYSENQSLTPFPFHPHWGFPQLGEMLYTIAFSFLGEYGPFGIQVVFFIFLVFSTFAFYGKKRGDLAPWFSLVVVTMPFVLNMMFEQLKVDVLFYFYFFCVLIVLRKIAQQKRDFLPGAYILLGFLLGFLFSVKYTAVFIIFLTFLFIFWQNIFQKIKFSYIVISLIAFLLVISPWMIKDMWYFNSPFVPITNGENIFFDTFGDSCHIDFQRQIKEDVALIYSKEHSFLWVRNILIFFQTQWMGLNSLTFPLNNPGVFFIVFLPILAFGFFVRITFFEKILAYFSLAYFFFWIFFLSGQVWYLAPSLFLWIFLGFSFFERIGGMSLKFLKGIILILCFFSFAFYLHDIPEKIHFFSAKTVRDNVDHASFFCSEKENNYMLCPLEFHYFEMMNFLNSRLKESSDFFRVYSFLEPQGYALEKTNKRFIPDFFGELFECFLKQGSVESVFETLNVRYIVINDFKLEEMCPKENGEILQNKTCSTGEKFKQLIRQSSNIQKIKSFGKYYHVYELTSEKGYVVD
jgi:hypothetical protein